MTQVESDPRIDLPPGDGWRMWIDASGQRPFCDSPTFALMNSASVEVWHERWGNETSFVTAQSLHPATNVYGLWWRPA